MMYNGSSSFCSFKTVDTSSSENAAIAQVPKPKVSTCKYTFSAE